jgi:hypothetical protein
MTNSFNKRKPNQQQTTDSIAPQTYKNASSLDQSTKSGFDLAHRAIQLLNKSELPSVIEDARVLEVLGDGQKVKYKILTQTPEINLKEEKDGYMEDYLIKARSRNDIGTKPDPEQILLNELKETMNDAEKQAVKRKYLEAVAMHDTLAPLYPSSFLSATPNTGDVIRIYYYNSLIDSGEEIKGFYEIMNHSSYFEKGEDYISNLLGDIRKKFSEIADKLQNLFGNGSDASSPSVQGQTGNVEDFAVQGIPNPDTRFEKYDVVPKVVFEGVDYSFARPSPESLVKMGISFVIRYVPYGATGKDLTKEELQSLLNAGLSVGFVFQRYGSEFQAQQPYIAGLGVKAGDSFGAGVAIANQAKNGLKKLEVPDDIVVYFAIEADKGNRHIREDEIPKIVEFFKGVCSVLPANRVGMYGGGPSMRAVMNANYAKYFWQSGAWSTDLSSKGKKILYQQTNLLQYKVIGGLDYNVSFSQDNGFLMPNKPLSSSPPTEEELSTGTSEAVEILPGTSSEDLPMEQ